MIERRQSLSISWLRIVFLKISHICALFCRFGCNTKTSPSPQIVYCKSGSEMLGIQKKHKKERVFFLVQAGVGENETKFEFSFL